MTEVDDFLLFAAVAEHAGFASAGRATGIPKSKLSRRVAGLERRLGVRLIERSTRRFRLTDAGQTLLAHCRNILIEVERARAATAVAAGEPRGLVRMSCPTGMIEELAGLIPPFLRKYPLVELHLIASDRPTDLIAERIDVALRVRTNLATDAAFTVKHLGRSKRILVAGPGLAGGLVEDDFNAVLKLPTLSSSLDPGPVTWRLQGPDGQVIEHKHEPRMRCEAFAALLAAAAAELGVALSPDHICARDIAQGTLVRVAPGWHAEEGLVHLVFTSSKGLPPAVRALIDHLASAFKDLPALRGEA